MRRVREGRFRADWSQTNNTKKIIVENWEISKIIPYARNPRQNDHAVDRMASAIREYGFRIPILGRSNGDLIDGHLRLKAARKLGLDQVPVIVCDDWTPAQVKAFRLQVNQSANWADWDVDLLALEMADLKEVGFDLALTGFDPPDISNLLYGDSDEAEESLPEIPLQPVSLPGDLWVCDGHRVLCGDATNQDHVASLLAGAVKIGLTT